MTETARRTKPLPHRCAHAGPMLVDPADGDAPCRALCLLCGTVGPARATPSKAARALRHMAVVKAETAQ
jgi:hypothetical protein